MTRSLRFLAISLLFMASGCARAQTANGTFDRTLSVGEPLELDVQTRSGSVDVRAGVAGKVEVHGEIRAGGWKISGAEDLVEKIKASPPIELDGNRLRIGHLDQSFWKQNISISYTIVVPTTTHLKSRTGSGAQTASGLAGTVVIESGSGSLTLRDVGGAAEARTGSGSITIDGKPTGPWELDTGSGAVRARMSPDAAFTIDAKAGSGGIGMSQAIAVVGTVERGQLQGQVRGGGPTVRIRTGSGGISVD